MTAPLSVIFIGFSEPFLNHLPTDGIMIGLSANSKKQLLEYISAHARAPTKVPTRKVFDSLTKRERNGSTGIGGRVAIPHAVFAKLLQSIDDTSSHFQSKFIICPTKPLFHTAGHNPPIKSLIRTSERLLNRLRGFLVDVFWLSD